MKVDIWLAVCLEDGDGYDEPDAMLFEPAEDGRKTDTEPTQGVTLKTGTGTQPCVTPLNNWKNILGVMGSEPRVTYLILSL